METINVKNAKILIADENPQSRLSLKEDLTRAGYKNVEEAVNGEDALMKIGRLHPDLVIADIWLSKIDGIGVLRNTKILDFGKSKAPDFIILSMVTSQSLFVEATNAGAQLCLLKPFDFDISDSENI